MSLETYFYHVRHAVVLLAAIIQRVLAARPRAFPPPIATGAECSHRDLISHRRRRFQGAGSPARLQTMLRLMTRAYQALPLPPPAPSGHQPGRGPGKTDLTRPHSEGSARQSGCGCLHRTRPLTTCQIYTQITDQCDTPVDMQICLCEQLIDLIRVRR